MPRPATIEAAAFLLDTSLQCIDLLGSQYAGVDGSEDVLQLLFLHRGLIVLLLASTGGLVIVDVLRGILHIQYLSLAGLRFDLLPADRVEHSLSKLLVGLSQCPVCAVFELPVGEPLLLVTGQDLSE